MGIVNILAVKLTAVELPRGRNKLIVNPALAMAGKQLDPLLPKIVSKSLPSDSYPLRLMSLNVWKSGIQVADGQQKIVREIKRANADVVALQEVNRGFLQSILNGLGPEWTGTERTGDLYPDSAIISRHLIDKSCSQTRWSLGCLITHKRNPSVQLHVWAIHLAYWLNGMEYACLHNKPPPLDSVRSDNIREMARLPAFIQHLANAENVPVVVIGDFNEASHLDWVESAKHLHCGQVCSWNSSLIMTRMGFTDAYRKLHPNPVSNPGITWSIAVEFGDGLELPVTVKEPQDRIDYVYYRGSKLTPTKALLLPTEGVNKPKPEHFFNQWPSDHWALVLDFRFKT